MNRGGTKPPYLDPAVANAGSAGWRGKKALFLDRDGVININHGYVHSVEKTEWVPGIFDLVARATDLGYAPVVVTNQAGIGRGYYSETVFLAYTAWIHAEFARRGLCLLATYWCPHHPTAGVGDYRMSCSCRKPAPGMLQAALEDFGFDPSTSLLIGDSETDIQAAASLQITAWQLFPTDWGKGMAGLIHR